MSLPDDMEIKMSPQQFLKEMANKKGHTIKTVEGQMVGWCDTCKTFVYLTPDGNTTIRDHCR